MKDEEVKVKKMINTQAPTSALVLNRSVRQYLQPNEQVLAQADVRMDLRSYQTNAETPVPWADLARPKHNGTVLLTADWLVMVFNPGNVRVISIPLTNVLMAWERTSEGRKPYPNQVVFVLPAGIFCVCELENADVEPIPRLRRIVHHVVRYASASVAMNARHTSEMTSTPGVDDGGVAAPLSAVI
jgi:hypothetical protein